MITIKLNDTFHQLEENTTLASFIDSLNIRQQGIAVAISYVVVPKDRWAETILADNQELMLIYAVSGG